MSASRARQVREVIDRLVRDGCAVANADGTDHTLFPVATSAAEGEALRSWVTREDVVQSIEVGLGYGISALFICEGLLAHGHATARHVVIDPHQATRFSNLGLQFLGEAGVAEMVDHFAEASQIVLPQLLSEGRDFDFAFVDRRHRFEAVFVDLYYLARIVRPAGIVFVDDYQLPPVAAATSFLSTDLGWTVEEVSAPDDLHQWIVLRTPGNAEVRRRS